MTDEAAEVARFIAEHGVTRCPTAYAAATQAFRDDSNALAASKRKRKWIKPGGKNHRSIDRFRRKALDILRNSPL